MLVTPSLNYVHRSYSIYLIIRLAPLYVCLSVSKLLRDRWTDCLDIWGKYAPDPGECQHLFFVTLNSRSRSQQRSNWLTQQPFKRFSSYLGYWCPLRLANILCNLVTLASRSRSQQRSNCLTQQPLERFSSYFAYWCPLGSANIMCILVTLTSMSRSQRRSNLLTQQPLGRFSSYLGYWCPLESANTLHILVTLMSKSRSL